MSAPESTPMRNVTVMCSACGDVMFEGPISDADLEEAKALVVAYESMGLNVCKKTNTLTKIEFHEQ